MPGLVCSVQKKERYKLDYTRLIIVNGMEQPISTGDPNNRSVWILDHFEMGGNDLSMFHVP